MKFHLTILLILFIGGCSQSPENVSAVNTNIKATPLPTISKEEKAKQEANERTQAINNFLAKHHRGWQYGGISNELAECEDFLDEICNVLITRGDAERVIPVKIKRFTDTENNSRLVVFEARPIDLKKAQIDAEEEK